MPLDFRPPQANRAVTVDEFVENPDMSWGHAGVGRKDGDDGEAEHVVRLLSLEAMWRRGSLSEAEFATAKQLLLREDNARI